MADQDMSSVSRLAYWLRDRLNAHLFRVIETDGRDVLDVRGGNFYKRLRSRGYTWERKVKLERVESLLPEPEPEVELLIGLATGIRLPESRSDPILTIQVLEHVFEPIRATEAMYRCLRPGGLLVILVPQSGSLHLVPHHYQNFTGFWVFEQARRMGAEIIRWKAIGGAWRTIAPRSFLIFWPVFDLHQTRDRALGRRH
jgi:SAM-dependent methyltransferase